MAMPSIEHAERVIDEVFRGRERVGKQEIFQKAAEASIAPDVMYYFRHLPEKEYTKRELVETINRMIRERGRQEEVGLLKV
ncbi:MAG TPA: hypothetical protein VIN09_00070 [Chloroflexota bacterium]